MYIFLYTIQLLSIKGAGIHTHISSVRELIISNLFRKQYFTINAGHCIYETFRKSFCLFVFASARTTESISVSQKEVFVISLLMNTASFYSYYTFTFACV